MPPPDPFSEPFESRTTLEIQGVGLQIASNSPEFVDYVPQHVHVFTPAPGSAPDVEVNVLWVRESDYDPDLHRFGGLDALDRIGKRMLGNESLLVCQVVTTVKRLQLRFRVDGRRLAVDAICRYRVGDDGRHRDGVEGVDAAIYKEFFKAMVHFVYYPLAWYLEHFRGLFLLHASAVELNGRAIVICGVGVGKSTTSVGMLVNAGARFISEILVFYDSSNIYGCYEPVRIGNASLAMLGATNGYLHDTGISRLAKKKNLYHVELDHIVGEAPAGAVFLPTFSSRTEVRPLDAKVGVDRMLAINAQSRKITDYYWFASALDMMWPRLGGAAQRVSKLTHLLASTRTFDLRIGPESGVEPVLDAILEQAGCAGVQVTGSRAGCSGAAAREPGGTATTRPGSATAGVARLSQKVDRNRDLQVEK